MTALLILGWVGCWALIAWSMNEFKHLRIVWVVKVRKSGRCVFEHSTDAVEDWKSHDGEWRIVYPKIMSREKFNSLPEHNGW
jgi:hypothetical protein